MKIRRYYSLTRFLFSFQNTEEDITDEFAIADLATREPDAPIFSKLGLSYGKAVRFKNEFRIGSEDRHKLSPFIRSIRTSPVSPVSSKPSMADLSTFSPEVKQLYLTKYVCNNI
jgi:hypothetical protein